MTRRHPTRGGPVKPGLAAATAVRPLLVSESTAIAERARTEVRETPTVIDGGGESGRLLVQLIRAGWSLNGVYYSAEVLRRDGAAAWPAGTLNYVDHDTDAEEDARPAGSLLRLASYQTTPARWDEARQALVAEVRVFAPWRETVADWAESGAIGMSIRAWVYGEHGEAEGRQGFVVSAIPEGRSVDYVTVPAAGGAILSVLESVRRRSTAEARNLGAWIESRLHLSLTQLGDDLYGDGRLTRPERLVLSAAIGDGLQAWTARVEADAPQLFTRDVWSWPEESADAAEEARRTAEQSAEDIRCGLGDAVITAYGDRGTWTWVRDFDPDQHIVWFNVSTEDSSALYQQSYTVGDDGVVALTGDRVEVVARTVYDPVGDTAADETAEAAETTDVTDGAPPTGSPNPTEEEPAMSGSQTGAPPEQAGTATVVDTPQAAPAVEATGLTEARVTELIGTATAGLTERLATTEQALTAERQTSEAERAENRRLRAQNVAREAVSTALNGPSVPADIRADITAPVTAAVLAQVPVTEAGDVDRTALDQRIAEAINAETGRVAALLERHGLGTPRGLGSTSAEPQTVAEFETRIAESFQKLGLKPEAAKAAAAGRR